jgi:hypothetical protein
VTAPNNLVPQFRRNVIGVNAIANNLRPNENYQLSALRRPAGARRKQWPNARETIEAGDAIAAAGLRFTNQSRQEYGLSVCNRN